MAKVIEIVGGPHDGKVIAVPADQQELRILLAPLPETVFTTESAPIPPEAMEIRAVTLRIDPLTWKAHWPKEPT